MSDLQPPLEFEGSEPIELQEEMEQSFLVYALSVITARALPDVRDGLKPVHRRILWDMFDQGFRPDRTRVKCARVTGHVMGQYHPHGNQAIYDALVRMAQPFSLGRASPCRACPPASKPLRTRMSDCYAWRSRRSGCSSSALTVAGRCE